MSHHVFQKFDNLPVRSLQWCLPNDSICPLLSKQRQYCRKMFENIVNTSHLRFYSALRTRDFLHTPSRSPKDNSFKALFTIGVLTGQHFWLLE